MLPALFEAMGDLATIQRDFVGAKKQYIKALEGFVKSKEAVGVSMVQRDLGTLSYLTGDSEDSQSWFSSALSSIVTQNKPELTADIVARQSLAIAKLGQINQAREQLKQCIDFWKSQKHSRWIARTKLQQAIVEDIAMNHGNARRLANEALESFNAVEDEIGQKESKEFLSSLP